VSDHLWWWRSDHGIKGQTKRLKIKPVSSTLGTTIYERTSNIKPCYFIIEPSLDRELRGKTRSSSSTRRTPSKRTGARPRRRLRTEALQHGTEHSSALNTHTHTRTTERTSLHIHTPQICQQARKKHQTERRLSAQYFYWSPQLSGRRHGTSGRRATGSTLGYRELTLKGVPSPCTFTSYRTRLLRPSCSWNQTGPAVGYFPLVGALDPQVLPTRKQGDVLGSNGKQLA